MVWYLPNKCGVIFSNTDNPSLRFITTGWEKNSKFWYVLNKNWRWRKCKIRKKVIEALRFIVLVKRYLLIILQLFICKCNNQIIPDWNSLCSIYNFFVTECFTDIKLFDLIHVKNNNNNKWTQTIPISQTRFVVCLNQHHE